MLNLFLSPLQIILCSISLLCSLIYFFTLSKRPYKCDFIFKGLSVALLAIVAVISLHNVIGILLLLSFLFATSGDVSLTFTNEKFFLVGLVSFLIAHIFTSILFCHLLSFPFNINLMQMGFILFFIVFALVMWNLLKSSLGNFKIPVIFYMFFLIAMGVTGILAKVNNIYIVCGVCLFIVSDSMLAWQKFKKSFYGADYLIWATYYAAQVLVPLGLILSPG